MPFPSYVCKVGDRIYAAKPYIIWSVYVYELYTRWIYPEKPGPHIYGAAIHGHILDQDSYTRASECGTTRIAKTQCCDSITKKSPRYVASCMPRQCLATSAIFLGGFVLLVIWRGRAASASKAPK